MTQAASRGPHRADGAATEQRTGAVQPISDDDPYRVSVDLRELHPHGLHAWRLLLIADVLRAVEEIVHGRQVAIAVVALDLAATTMTGAGMSDSRTRVTSPAAVTAALGGPPAFSLVPTRHRIDTDHDHVAHTLQIGAVQPPAGTEDTLVSAFDGHDLLALRLVLLRCAPTRPATLSVARLHRADETLQRWRYKVALWADMPAVAPVDELLDAAHSALEASLDPAVTVLTKLHRLEVEPGVASGSMFATFAYLDGVLGLGLRHLVGKVHR